MKTTRTRNERLARAFDRASESRRNILSEKSDKLRAEWIRAEKAEALLLAVLRDITIGEMARSAVRAKHEIAIRDHLNGVRDE